MFHKFTNKLIAPKQPVASGFSRVLVERLYAVRLYAGVVNGKRYRVGRMRTVGTRRRMVGQHGDGHRFFPIFHGFIYRTYSTAIVCNFNSTFPS